MNNHRLQHLLLGSLLLACCQVSATEKTDEPQANALPAASHPLIYSYQEMFEFDIEAYLASQAPHLLPYAETISHWAGYSSISPRVLLTLIDLQSGLLSEPRRGLLKNRLATPLPGLSQRQGFAGQVQDVADQLARQLYQQPALQAAEFGPRSKEPLSYLLQAPAGEPAPSRQLLDFSSRYQQLFGDAFTSPGLQALPDVTPLAGPANGFLQFPFPLGQNWHVGGAHTNTGSGSYPMSSLDMSQGGGWGSNQSGVWVAASAAGSFKRHSSCFAEIVHSGGWSTTYYHLMNVQYNTGASVAKNTRIANPANTQAQALCNGGASTGPHQHWSLKQNGSWVHLNTVYLSGWQVTATGSSYDTNCNRFYLSKNGVKKCAGWFNH